MQTRGKNIIAGQISAIIKKVICKLLIILISMKQNKATLIHVGCRSDAKMFKTQAEPQVVSHFDVILMTC